MAYKTRVKASIVWVWMIVTGCILVSMGLSFGAEASTYYDTYERYTAYAEKNNLSQDYLTYELIKEAKDEQQRGSVSAPTDWRGYDAQQRKHVIRNTLWQMEQDSTLMNALVVDQLILMNDTLQKTHPSDAEDFSKTLRAMQRSSAYKYSKQSVADSSPWVAGMLVMAVAGFILVVIRRA